MAETVELGDHLDFGAGSTPPVRSANGRYPVYGANGAIGYAAEHNARGPLIVIGRVGSFCGSLHYSEGDVWVTDNALTCRAQDPAETRYWYYALQSCGLNRLRAGSGQPLLNQSSLRSVRLCVAVASERRPIGEILGALDDKIAANGRVIAAAEALMKALIEQVEQYTTLASLAERSATFLDPRDIQGTVAHYSFTAFDKGVRPIRVDAKTIKSTKFLLTEPCVLFSKLNPRIPRIWNVVGLAAEKALASSEFVVLRPIDVDTSALWAALGQPDVLASIQQLVAGMTGSRQRIQPRDLLRVPVRDVRRLSPGSARTIASLGAVCERGRAESAALSAVRETLLPLLVSSAVRVRDFAASVGESVLAESRRAAAEKMLQELDTLLANDDKSAIRQNQAELYDDHGLPR